MWFAVRTEPGTGKILEELIRHDEQSEVIKKCVLENDFVGFLKDEEKIPINALDWAEGFFPLLSEVRYESEQCI